MALAAPEPLLVDGHPVTLETTPVTPEELANLYGLVGWHVLPADYYRRAIAGNFVALAARDAAGKLVGYGRALSDGGIHSWIHDLIVVPGLRGKGIGGRILEGLVASLRTKGIPYIGLFSARGRAGFYELHGFQRRPEDAPGMFLYMEPE